MKRGLTGLFVAVAMFAAPQVMTNQTVEAMIYGGVPLPIIVSAIRTAARIQFSETKQDYDRLIAAGSSPTAATEIMKAIHHRQYSGIDNLPAQTAVTSVQTTPTVSTNAVQVASNATAEITLPAVAPPPTLPRGATAPVETRPVQPTPVLPAEPNPSVALPLQAAIPEPSQRDAVENKTAMPTVESRTAADPPQSSCPIGIKQIHPHWLFGDGDPWGSYLMVQFTNNSSKTIAAVRFGVAFVDALADTHESVYSYDSDSTVKPGKSSHPLWSDGVYAGSLGHKVGAIVWVEKLRFADNTFFVDNGTHSCGAHTK